MSRLLKVFLIALIISGLVPNYASAKKKTTVNLENKGITDVSNLKFRSGVRKISLAKNQIVDVSSLQLPDSLRKLDLFENQIVDISTLVLPEGLTFLELGDNQISDINGLQLPSTLREIFFFLDKINDDGIKNAIFPNSLEELNLDANRIQDPRVINYPPNLKILFLSFNQIGRLTDEGINPRPFDGLVLPESLERLFLDSNSIDGGQLADLILPPNLKLLNLNFNIVSDLTGLNYPDSLERLDLRKLTISGDFDSSKIKVGPNIKKLDLGLNRLTNFSNFPVMPATLRVISLEETGLEDSSVDNLIRVLPRKMRKIDLRNNSFSKSSKKKLRKAFPKAKIKFGFVGL